MSQRVLIFFGAGIAVVAIALGFFFWGTKGNHLELKGEVLKVRTVPSDESNSIAVLDFRVTNSSDVPFVIKTAEAIVIKSDGSSLETQPIARSDMDRLFQYQKLLGPKYNQTVITHDQIEGRQTIDRMIGVAIPLKDSDLAARKEMRLRLENWEGLQFELAEKR